MAKAKSSGRLSATTVAAIGFIILSIVILGGSVILQLANKTEQNTTSAVKVVTPAVSNSDSNRQSNVVAGTDWKYTINPVARKKFSIVVQKGTVNSEGEISIYGKGCNEMGAQVTSVDNKAQPSTEKIVVNGTTYYLQGPVTTMIACTGEAATFDESLITEIKAIFHSLHK